MRSQVYQKKFFGPKPNTVKSNVVERIKSVSEREPKVTISRSDFEEEIDTAILVRERTKGSKLESQYKTKARKVLKETAHTITFSTKKSKNEVLLSKRDVAKDSAEQAGTNKRKAYTR